MEGESITPLPVVNNGNFPKISWSGQKIPKLSKSSDIKSEYKNVECLKDYFKGVDEWNDSDTAYQQVDPSFGFVGQNNDETKSCLVVEYYKQTQEDKWWGEFKLVWSLSEKGDAEGLITVFNAKTENGKLKTDTSVYVVKKGGNDQKRLLANQKQESEEHEITGNDDLSNYFPKWGDSMKNEENDDYWGFDPKVDKICKSDECLNITGSATTTHKQWKWNKNSSSGTSITSWSSNFDTWFDKLLANKWSKIKEELKKLKGTWNKQ